MWLIFVRANLIFSHNVRSCSYRCFSSCFFIIVIVLIGYLVLVSQLRGVYN